MNHKRHSDHLQHSFRHIIIILRCTTRIYSTSSVVTLKIMTPCRTSSICKANSIMPRSKCFRSSFLPVLMTIFCCLFRSSHSFVSKVSRFGVQDINKVIRSRPNQAVTTANPLEQSSQSPRHSSSSVRMSQMNEHATSMLSNTAHYHEKRSSHIMHKNIRSHRPYLRKLSFNYLSHVRLVYFISLIGLFPFLFSVDN